MNLYYSEKWKGTNLTVLMVVGLVLTIIAIILGIFLYPMLAYIMNSVATIFYLGFVLMIISFIILIVSITKAIHYAKKQPNDYKKRKAVFCSPIVIISFFLLVIFATNFGLYAGKFSLSDFDHIRWGKCWYSDDRCRVYSMLGIEKINGEGYLYPVYFSNGEKGFVDCSPVKRERDGENYYKYSFNAKVYNDKGNYIQSYDFNEGIYEDDYRDFEWNGRRYREDDNLAETFAKDVVAEEIGCSFL